MTSHPQECNAVIPGQGLLEIEALTVKRLMPNDPAGQALISINPLCHDSFDCSELWSVHRNVSKKKRKKGNSRKKKSDKREKNKKEKRRRYSDPLHYLIVL